MTCQIEDSGELKSLISAQRHYVLVSRRTRDVLRCDASLIRQVRHLYIVIRPSNSMKNRGMSFAPQRLYSAGKSL